MKILSCLLAFLLSIATALGAELPPPGSSGNLAGNNSGAWAAFSFSNCTVTGTSISCPGTISSYPAAGVPQSTGSAWGSSITPGTGVATALANAINASGGFLTYGGIPYAALPALSANQVLGALTATTPSGLTVPSCSAAGNALEWTSGTGFSCAAGFLTSNQSIALSGDVSGSGTTAITTTLATVNSNTGSFGSASNCLTVTVNGKGLITAASQAACAPALANITGFGTGVVTALGVAVGSAGAPVVNGGVLGTPSSGTATNLTGTAAGLTAGAAQGLVDATTTVSVSAATAPTVGQILTATSSTVANWQTPTNAVGPSLANLYRLWNTLGSQIVRIENLGDSILTCNQSAPCSYGPARLGSTFPLQLINELAQRYQQYSTGYRAIVRLSNGTTTVSAADGYTLTSGSLTNSTLLGPQESGVSLNGGSLLTLSNGGVITINVGQPYSSINIACVTGSGINGYTVTINGSSVGQACNAASGSNTVTYANFANPVAFASQPATGSTLTLTALGATNYLYAYEGVLFCGASNTACTTGFALDNFGVGGASSPWFASGTKTGTGSAGMVWVNALAGKVALCVLENGENDAQASSGPVTSTQQNTQNQAVATACQTLGASVLFWVPPPYNNGGSPAVYAGLQQGSLTYCQSQGWACLNMADIFVGSISGTTSSAFPFSAQDTGMGLTPPWGVAQGLITNSDAQHLNDCGELLATQQFLATVFPHIIFNYTTTSACNQNPQHAGISSAYANATTGFTIVQGCAAANPCTANNTGQLEFVAPLGQTFGTICRGYMTVGTTGAVSFELVGSASIANINITLKYQTAANSAYSFVSATALATALTTSSITAASNLEWIREINGVNSTSSNSFAVEAHEASGTLTIPAGATCTNQLSGPQ